MIIKDLIKSYQNQGFKLANAETKVCQDLFMYKLSKSKYASCITFKGGTVMYEITKESRRATKDLDVDVINLSIAEETITKIVNEIGKKDNETKTSFRVLKNKTEDLKHRSYKGKRFYLEFKDQKGDKLELALDVGVHKHSEIKQTSLVFDIFESGRKVSLLVNPIEQMIVEKTSSIIDFGIFTTRIKDFYDLYYLINYQEYEKELIVETIIRMYINTNKVNGLEEYNNKIQEILSSPTIKTKMGTNNWLDVGNEEVLSSLKTFFDSLIG